MGEGQRTSCSHSLLFLLELRCGWWCFVHIRALPRAGLTGAIMLGRSTKQTKKSSSVNVASVNVSSANAPR